MDSLKQKKKNVSVCFMNWKTRKVMFFWILYKKEWLGYDMNKQETISRVLWKGTYLDGRVKIQDGNNTSFY